MSDEQVKQRLNVSVSDLIKSKQWICADIKVNEFYETMIPQYGYLVRMGNGIKKGICYVEDGETVISEVEIKDIHTMTLVKDSHVLGHSVSYAINKLNLNLIDGTKNISKNDASNNPFIKSRLDKLYLSLRAKGIKILNGHDIKIEAY